MPTYSFEDIHSFLTDPYQIVGDPTDKTFSNVKPIFDNVTPDTLVWVSTDRKDRQQLVEQTAAGIVICDPDCVSMNELTNRKLFIIVDKPKLLYLKIVRALFQKRVRLSGVHPTAIIHPDATIGSDVYIGPYTCIGRASIGNGTIIHGHCYIYDDVRIGANVKIDAGTVIGADGFGYERNHEGVLELFPHIGGVVIEDDVEIGSNASIDRGSMSDTLIKRGARIDNLVNIAHNVTVGEHTAVVATAIIAGSVKIGDYSWIGPASAVNSIIKIGDHALTGIGAVVTHDVPDGEAWSGFPARRLIKQK